MFSGGKEWLLLGQVGSSMPGRWGRNTFDHRVESQRDLALQGVRSLTTLREPEIKSAIAYCCRKVDADWFVIYVSHPVIVDPATRHLVSSIKEATPNLAYALLKYLFISSEAPVRESGAELVKSKLENKN
ncbi:MAG: hypothetical protein ACI97B_002726 [Verrucomicrobiales bacterium]|jgi:hypothetical protein